MVSLSDSGQSTHTTQLKYCADPGILLAHTIFILGFNRIKQGSKLQVAQPVKIFSAFYCIQNFSQAVATKLCPELEESNPYNHILFLKEPFNFNEPSVSSFPKCSLHFTCFNCNVHLSHIHAPFI